MKTPMKASGSAKSERQRAGVGPVHVTGDRLTLSLHVQPGARTTEWAGRHGDAVRLRVAARAVDGQANQACIEFIAESAGVPRSAVAIVHGERSRGKVFRIDGISPGRVQMLLEACGL